MLYVTPHLATDGYNTAQASKADPGTLYYLHVVNSNTADAYLQLFDAATGDVTVGTTTPVLTLLIPGGDGTNSGALDRAFNEAPINFETAITYACTTTPTGSGDPTTGLTVNATYR